MGSGAATRPTGEEMEWQKQKRAWARLVHNLLHRVQLSELIPYALLPRPCARRNGVCTYPDGSRYEGDWEEDARCGWGRLDAADGQSYEGEWRFDTMHGEGAQEPDVRGGAGCGLSMFGLAAMRRRHCKTKTAVWRSVYCTWAPACGGTPDAWLREEEWPDQRGALLLAVLQFV